MSALADPPLSTGDTNIVRSGVNYALHVPADAVQPHGPLATLVFFGGYGDAAEYYQKALAPISDELDFILAVPQLPWFREPGKANEEEVLDSLNALKVELESRFHTDSKLVIVSGGSAGGPIACELASRWSSNVPLLVLHSTRYCPTKNAARILHLVGEKEVSLLGSEGRSGKVLGSGRKDLYAVPGAGHEVHVRPMRLWLQTELAAVRLENVAATISQTEGKGVAARGILKSSLDAAALLSEVLPAGDDFVTYQNSRRQELREKYRVQIERLNDVAKAAHP
jgi:hypothetical protein